MARPRTHDAAVRDRLLEHASEAISDGGPAGLSLRAVSRAAGTTTAAVYSLFGSREALIGAVVTEGFRRFAAHLGAAPRSADPGADLLALGVAYRRSALADPHFYRVMFTPVPSAAGSPGTVTAAPSPAADRPTFGVLCRAVERLLAAQGRQRAEAEEIAVRLWALVHGLVSLELAGLLPGSPGERERRYLTALRSTRI